MLPLHVLWSTAGGTDDNDLRRELCCSPARRCEPFESNPDVLRQTGTNGDRLDGFKSPSTRSLPKESCAKSSSMVSAYPLWHARGLAMDCLMGCSHVSCVMSTASTTAASREERARSTKCRERVQTSLKLSFQTQKLAGCSDIGWRR